MRRVLLGLLLTVLAAVPGQAQTQQIDTGSITAVSSGGACTAAPAGCAVFSLPNAVYNSITLQVSGTYVGTLAFEATSSSAAITDPNAASVTWFSISGTKLADGSSATGPGADSTGQFAFQNTGLTGIRVRATAWTSGTATITAVRGYASARWLSPFFTRVYTGDGTAALPAWSFSSDTDTGLYRIGADNVGFSAGGTLRWDYNTSRILSTIPIISPNGLVSAPGFAFSGATTTGWYWTSDAINGAVTGVNRLHLSAGVLALHASTSLSWSPGVPVTDGTDLSLFRDNSDTLAQKRGASAQSHRWYFNTTGPIYTGLTARTAGIVFTSVGGSFQLSTAQTTAPTCSANCGTSPSVAGTDTAGIVTMGATGVPASGWVVTFNGTWTAAPACTVIPALAGMAVGKIAIVVATTTTTFTVTTNGTAPSTSDKYAYTCVGVS